MRMPLGALAGGTAKPSHSGWAESVLRQVFLAAPGQFDSFTWHCHGQAHRLIDEIGFQSSPEAAAHGRDMQVHLGWLQAGQLGRLLEHQRGHLGADPQIKLAFVQACHRSGWLQGRVRQKGGTVFSFEGFLALQRGDYVAVVAELTVLVRVVE